MSSVPLGSGGSGWVVWMINGMIKADLADAGAAPRANAFAERWVGRFVVSYWTGC
jgi:hypothetical protein